MSEVRSKYMRVVSLFKAPVSREGYILRALQRAFPTGGYVEGEASLPVSEKPSESRTEPNPTTPAYITVIGGTKYHRPKLDARLSIFVQKNDGLVIVVGDGRGAEKDAATMGWFQEYVHIPVNPDFYGKAARKVNVDEVLNYAPDSPLLLVGAGERVKQARSWLKRTGSKREVIEIL